jgi:phosphonoacetaldehyde hydrolase
MTASPGCSGAPAVDSGSAAAARTEAPARRLRAVVLDWAGTTQDFGSLAPVGALIEVFARFGVAVTTARARSSMGLYKRDHIRAIAADPDIAPEWERVHGGPCTEADVQAMYEALVPIQEALLPRFCDLIPGTVEAIAEIRARGCLVGSTTGYPRRVGAIAARIASEQGYEPDAMVCADEVVAGRPEPWMLLRAMEVLRVYPPSAVVKVGDTTADIEEGLNAGAWTVGVTRTGNYVGLSRTELAALPADARDRLIRDAGETLRGAGAHFLIRSIGELPPVLDEIEICLALGERP